ncbi:hypothetical protein [Streptomyces sp. GQFP]|uniref:hypothetical protein n=1 Tax=Streptomyces sp. GQFP TaxID=2907545 RepID=UPI001F379DA3|nr:hypothetical protein [Streptomyces sp. GQFP]UIX32994.1 hypothetical protein LUX31_24920 [Streptomyces sp. GQFP]
MATQSAQRMSQAGQDWLLNCAAHPADVQRTWDVGELAEFPTGPHWHVAEVPIPRSLEALARIGGGRIGPALADVHRGVAWWLLPPDLTDELDGIRRLTVRPPGWVLTCPPVLHSVNGRWWIERPDGSGRLTDPVLLGAALSLDGAQLPTEANR